MAFATRTLGEICDEADGIIQTGPFGSQLHQSDYRDEGTPVVMPKDLADDRVSVESIARIGEEDVERLARHRLETGDIVYARRGDIGRRALITSRETGWMCGTGCMRISLGDTILNPRFLFYYLGQPDIVTWIYNQAVGATMPNLNTSIVRSVPVKYPPLPTQRKIAAVLSAYDDLIENNTHRIAVLEEMARLLYQEWFVRFRFPGHEDVPMVDSELGPVPEGWEVVSFADTADVLSGGTPQTKVHEYWNGHIPFFSPRDVSTSFYVMKTERSITELGLNNCSSELYPKDTVFITARGTVGNVVMPAVDMAMNQSCYALRGEDGISQYFVFMNIRDQVDRLKQRAHGAVFDTIIVDTFRQLKVVKPPKALVDIFHRQVLPIFKQMLSLLNRNLVLRDARDLLLPRLISGEISVASVDIGTDYE